MSNKLNKPTRRAVVLNGTVAAGALISLSPRPALAFWPLLLRLGATVVRKFLRPIARPMARGLFGRSTTTMGLSASTVLATTASANAKRTHAARNKFELSASLGLSFSPVFSMDPQVAAQIRRHNAQSLWVKNMPNQQFLHELSISSTNQSTGHRLATVVIEIRDSETGRLEQEHGITVQFAPNDQVRLSIPIDVDRLRSGAKTLSGKAYENGIQRRTMADVSFEAPQKVVVTDYQKVVMNDE